MFKAKKIKRLPVGSLCHFTTVSAASLSLYMSIIKQRVHPKDFVCPCHIPSTEALEITNYIGNASVLLKIKSSKKISCAVLEDLASF